MEECPEVEEEKREKLVSNKGSQSGKTRVRSRVKNTKKEQSKEQRKLPSEEEREE